MKLERNVKNTKWKLLDQAHTSKHGPYWFAQCECGVVKTILLKNYKNGQSLSCGCYNKSLTKGRPSVLRKDSGVSDLNHLFLVYKNGSKGRKLSFELTKQEFKELTSNNCTYCGVEPKQKTGRKKYTQTHGEYIYNGIDRIDNSLGYIKENCVPCCKICNYAKHKLTQLEFTNWLSKIVDFQMRKSKQGDL